MFRVELDNYVIEAEADWTYIEVKTTGKSMMIDHSDPDLSTIQVSKTEREKLRRLVKAWKNDCLRRFTELSITLGESPERTFQRNSS